MKLINNIRTQNVDLSTQQISPILKHSVAPMPVPVLVPVLVLVNDVRYGPVFVPSSAKRQQDRNNVHWKQVEKLNKSDDVMMDKGKK